MTSSFVPCLDLVRKLALPPGGVITPSWIEDAFSLNPKLFYALRAPRFSSVFPILDPNSPPVAVGQCVTEVDSDDDVVTLATREAFAVSNAVTGIVIEAGAPGDYIRIATNGVIGRQFLPFLGDGADDFGLWNPDNLRVERLASRVPEFNNVVGQVIANGKLSWSTA